MGKPTKSARDQIISAPTVHEVISKTYSDKVQTNRDILLSILDVLLNLAKWNVALRGKWNGNFQHFANWKAKFDDTLKSHMEIAPRNARYMSPSIQNGFIACCGAEIQEIVHKIHKSKYYSVLADETADVSGTDTAIHLHSFCVRRIWDTGGFSGCLSTWKAGCCIHHSCHPIAVRQVGASCLFSAGLRIRWSQHHECFTRKLD